MVFGGMGSMLAIGAAGGMFWLVGQINPYADKTAMVLAGLAMAAVGYVANRTDFAFKSNYDPQSGKVVKERHHIFWVNVEWWGLALAALGMFLA